MNVVALFLFLSLLATAEIEFQREPMDDESTAAAPNIEKKVNPLVLCLTPLSKAKDVIGSVCRYTYGTVNLYVPGEQGRAKIGQLVGKAAVYGLPEFLKYWAPGVVPFYNIAIRSLPEGKPEDYKELKRENEHWKEELKTLQTRFDKLERQLSGGGDNIQDNVKFGRDSSVGENNQADGKNSNPHLKADDAIRMFTMPEISGRYMFDDLVVPGFKKSRKEV